jgi:hypothetical protein
MLSLHVLKAGLSKKGIIKGEQCTYGMLADTWLSNFAGSRQAVGKGIEMGRNFPNSSTQRGSARYEVPGLVLGETTFGFHPILLRSKTNASVTSHFEGRTTKRSF